MKQLNAKVELAANVAIVAAVLLYGGGLLKHSVFSGQDADRVKEKHGKRLQPAREF